MIIYKFKEQVDEHSIFTILFIQLNQESSRSHTIFNIRLVKTYPSGEGEIDLERPCLLSQLALVDLAGAERAQRTGNAGQALKEAGKLKIA